MANYLHVTKEVRVARSVITNIQIIILKYDVFIGELISTSN